VIGDSATTPTRADLLKQYLAEAWGRPYLVGHWDCIIFVAMWADTVAAAARRRPSEGRLAPSDLIHTAALRDTYTTEQRGRELYAPGGINLAILQRLTDSGWQAVKRGESGKLVDVLEPGDIVLTNLDHPGIWTGDSIAAQPARASGILKFHAGHGTGGLRW